MKKALIVRVILRTIVWTLPVCALAACDGERSSAQSEAGLSTEHISGRKNVVVVAVIDDSINPYHWDFLADKTPQHSNADPVDDLPLDQDPASWILGHPGASAFLSYEPLNLSVAQAAADPQASASSLHTQDQAEWDKVHYSGSSRNSDVHMYWVPGTKIVGHVVFRPSLAVVEPTTTNLTDAALGPASGPVDTFSAQGHGIATASVSVGNIHGTCPNCVFVMVHGYSEVASAWVASQDWIDLQTNSWGLSTLGGLVRDNVYAGGDTEIQRLAVERGQAWFQSAGNGLENGFIVPSTTLLSSQKGPDWIVTVGAIEPDGSSVGHNRPVDISSIGSRYPSATNGDNSVTAEGNFDGTSNATPVIAGLYAEALYRLRVMLRGPGRMQSQGVIATGPAGCDPANSDCALADGMVTVHELESALLQSSRHTPEGTTLLNQVGGPDIPGSENWAELEYMSEGHGSYFGRLLGNENFDSDVQRILDVIAGRRRIELAPDLKAWLIADSRCRQSVWGAWQHGYFDGANAPPHDFAWPIRNWLVEDCPRVLPPLKEALESYGDASRPGNS